MNREIKFRAWDECQMIYPSLDGHGQLTSAWILNNYSHIMQFTGLHDKNGKEIYEGDIITASMGESGVIVWNEGIAAFQYAYHAIGKGTAIGGRMTNTLYKCKTYEVIGNIYENPELLNDN